MRWTGKQAQAEDSQIGRRSHQTRRANLGVLAATAIERLSCLLRLVAPKVKSTDPDLLHLVAHVLRLPHPRSATATHAVGGHGSQLTVGMKTGERIDQKIKSRKASRALVWSNDYLTTWSRANLVSPPGQMVPENLSEPAGASVPTVTKSPRPTGRGGEEKRSSKQRGPR